MIHTRDGRSYPHRGQLLRTWPERGYLCVRLGQGRQYGVHRLVLLAFVGPCPPELDEALHRNGDRSDARLVNLHWGTKSENMLDRVRHGTCPMSSKTHCPRSHPLVAPNLIPSNLRNGDRACWACSKANRKIHWCEENGFVPPDIQEESDRWYRLILAGKTDGRAGRKMTKWLPIDQQPRRAS
jgi:hypothetical protein